MYETDASVWIVAGSWGVSSSAHKDGGIRFVRNVGNHSSTQCDNPEILNALVVMRDA